jgi:hypothetical protein
MTETNIIADEMAGIALKLMPPIIRDSLLSDQQFKARFNLKTETSVVFSDPKVSFSRSKLFNAVRSLYAEPSSTQILFSVENAQWSLTLETGDDRPTVILTHDTQRIDLSDLWPLSPDAAVRLRCLEGFADSCNLIGTQFTKWRVTLASRPVADDELDDLHSVLKPPYWRRLRRNRPSHLR